MSIEESWGKWEEKSIKYFLTVFLVFIVGVSGQLEVLAET